MHASDYVSEADAVMLLGRAVYPTDLNERGDLCGHPSKAELTLKERGLPGGVNRKQAEPAVGDIIYVSIEGSWLFLGMIRSQFATFKFSVDRVAGLASFYRRL